MPSALSIVQRFYPNVRSVTDTKKNVFVEVTIKDCKSKAVKNHQECALALACKRTMGLDGVIIAMRVAYLVKGKEAVRFGLGESIAREITAFDRNGSFHPGKYILLKPSHRIGNPASSGTKNGYQKGKSGRKIAYHHLTQDVRHIYEERAE